MLTADKHPGGPDLCQYGNLAVADKGVDLQVLLKPFEKQFHLPTWPVDTSNELGKQIASKPHLS